MKRFCIPVVVALFAWTAPLDVSAQGIFVGGGVTVPTSDFGDFANTGWMGFAGVLTPVGDQGFSVGAEGFFGSNGHEIEGDKTNLYGGMALASLSFGGETAPATPFVFGGLGFMTHSYKSESTPQFEDSATGMTLGGGGGVTFPLGGAQGILAGTYIQGFGDIDETSLFGISAGVQFLFGN